MRATSWRSSRIRAVLSSWPVASWNRRLNSSSFAASMRDVELVRGQLAELGGLARHLATPPPW